jgi:hypothetical protein
VKNEPTIAIDPAGLDVQFTGIEVSNKGMGFPNSFAQGSKLGPKTGPKTLSYGFVATVEAKVSKGDSIEKAIKARKADLQQDVFMVGWIKNPRVSREFVQDKNGRRKAKEGEWGKAIRVWLEEDDRLWNNMDFDHGGPEYFTNPLGNKNVRFANDGRSVEYQDYPGWNPEIKTPLPASNWDYASFRYTFKIVATGTDGKSVTAKFSIAFVADSKAGQWVIRDQNTGTWPELPHRWP